MRALPLIFVAIHSVWVLLVASVIWVQYVGPGYQQELEMWLLVFLPDIPAVYMTSLFGKASEPFSFPGLSSHVEQVVIPAVYFLLFGGLQWWATGWIISRAFGYVTRDSSK